LASKKWVTNIQTAGYNGARTVVDQLVGYEFVERLGFRLLLRDLELEFLVKVTRYKFIEK
jgi:hypothetical protein